MEIAQQREWHRRAQAGDRAALDALYRSMLPLIKSRVQRVLARYRGALGGWYDLDDLFQDAYLVFHRFVMASDPDTPLFRLVAGAFEPALRTYLRRRGPLRRALPVIEVQFDGGDEEGPPADEFLHIGPNEAAWDANGRTGCPIAWVCAQELLDALPSEDEREVVRLTAAGFTAREAAQRLGCTVAAVWRRRRRIRAHLARRGLISDSRRTARR